MSYVPYFDLGTVMEHLCHTRAQRVVEKSQLGHKVTAAQLNVTRISKNTTTCRRDLARFVISVSSQV